MPFPKLLHSLLLAVGLGVGCGVETLAAQRTWLVDAAGRPDADFTSIGAAVAHASAGDVLLVRAGNYLNFGVDKALTILGEPGATRVQGIGALTPCFRVSSIPAGRTVRIYGLTLRSSFVQTVEVTDCAGRVHLEQITHAVAPPLGTWSGITITRSSAVTLVDCGSTAHPFAVRANLSDVQVIGCTLQGASALESQTVGAHPAASGLTASTSGVVEIVDSIVTGGDGLTGMWTPARVSAAAILVNGATVVVRSSATTRIAAGGGTMPVFGVSAIRGFGMVRYDPSVTLTPFGDAPSIEATLPSIAEPLPGLSQSGGERGGTFDLFLRSPAGGAFVVIVGTLAAPAATPFGNLYLDALSMTAVVFGTQAATGATTFPFAIPTAPSMRGQEVAFQAAAMTPIGLRTTNACVAVFR